MNKYVTMAAILSLLLLAPMVLAPRAAPPPISRPMDLYTATLQGGSPETVDYSWAYDTASGEIIQNVMDTLVTFDGEHLDSFIGRVATNWTSFALGPGGVGIDSGNPISGLTFASPANQTGPNAKWFFRYVFQIRTGIVFQPPYNYSLTPADVAYSFQRTMVQDRASGPQFMLQEPLLDNPAGDDASAGGIADLTNMTEVAELGALIRDSVQYNSTHVWFNLMFPGSYAPFMQILSQTWSAIESKQWINNQVITGAGRPDWNGDWSNITAWVASHSPSVSPLDDPTPMMYGSGPFRLLTLDYAGNFWELGRYVNYWAGWPSDFPTMAGASPAGYVNTVHETWAFDWSTSSTMFKSGDVDFVALPSRSRIPELFSSTSPPYYPPNYPLAGIRQIAPLPSLSAAAVYFTFNIDPTTAYGPIGPAGIFNETLIPTDFFGNPSWGINVRKGFVQAFDFNTYGATAYLGESIAPATAIVPGIPYYDPSVVGYSFNLAAANASLNAVPGLSTAGFTLTITYNTGNTARRTAGTMLRDALQSLNPRFHINVVNIDWGTYLVEMVAHRLPVFVVGWLADFPDAHDWALPFYASYGTYGQPQGYSSATMDALIAQGIATPDGPARQAIYTKIQQLAIADVPSFMIAQVFGRHFERDWVQGWYYNSVYPGLSYFNMWKWYYTPAAQRDTTGPPEGYNEPADVNYDGKVDMKDIGTDARSFGATAGPPIHPRWVFRADMNVDRKIDMKDIGYVAKQFGKSSAKWAPS